MKQKILAHVYAWVHSNGTLGEFSCTRYEMNGEQWLPVHKDPETGRSKAVEIEVEIPDSFAATWRNQALANIEHEERVARAELQRKLVDLWDLRDKLLAIEFDGVER